MINFLRHNIAQTLCRLYRTIIIPVRASQLRRKDKIEVLFLLSYRAKWKSESIYKAMHAHPRFSPLLLISNEDEPKEEEALLADAGMNVSEMAGRACTIKANQFLEDGQEMTLEGMTFRVILTPGHTAGSCC